MKIKLIILIFTYLSSSISLIDIQNSKPFFALLFEQNSNSQIYYANAKALTINGDSISMVTSGDEGMIHFSSLPNEFILKIYHNNYLEYTDTIFKYSNRIRNRIELTKR